MSSSVFCIRQTSLGQHFRRVSQLMANFHPGGRLSDPRSARPVAGNYQTVNRRQINLHRTDQLACVWSATRRCHYTRRVVASVWNCCDLSTNLRHPRVIYFPSARAAGPLSDEAFLARTSNEFRSLPLTFGGTSLHIRIAFVTN